MQRLLIANRGEIACRIMRTAQRLQLQTIAVYSDIDRDALHVQLADEAIHIGAAPPGESYLDIDAIVAAAERSGADAVHPGYGFLSENAAFARRLEAAGIAFVGPPAAAIDAMGSKAAAKSIMAAAGVPLLPGYHGDAQDDDTLRGAADDIGYPVLLKASAGGGGKGMRVVASSTEFTDALAAARREARGAFGDDTMLVEKYLAAPRHIELQVFADAHGNIVHLFDRDCSIQRRHQKIVEEAPAPGLSESLREQMASAAIAAARAIDYVGAGTVEFLLDRDEAFYFMEMNTRLQVEHPVTEMITGQDLVAWQLQVAAGQSLPLAQDELQLSGHAIECRVYAEDADAGFLPASGRIERWQQPPPQPGWRIDSGVRSGDEISVFYDPMIAKVVAHANARALAVNAMRELLSACLLSGITNNLGFLQRVVNDETFRTGIPDTNFVDTRSDTLRAAPIDTATWIAAALALRPSGDATAAASQPWQRRDGWRANAAHVVALPLIAGDSSADIALHYANDRALPVAAVIDGERLALDAQVDAARITLVDHGRRRRFRYLRDDHGLLLSDPSGRWRFRLRTPDFGDATDATSDGSVRAPMTGRILSVACAEGDTVAAGATLIVLEAMKMEHTIKAPISGTVTTCNATTGALVEGQQLLLTITDQQPATQ